MEGNLYFKIDWASLIVGSKFTIFDYPDCSIIRTFSLVPI